MWVSEKTTSRQLVNKVRRWALKVTLENSHSAALVERYSELGALASLLVDTTPDGFVSPLTVIWSQPKKTWQSRG